MGASFCYLLLTIRHCEPLLPGLHECWNHWKGARQSAYFLDLSHSRVQLYFKYFL